MTFLFVFVFIMRECSCSFMAPGEFQNSAPASPPCHYGTFQQNLSSSIVFFSKKLFTEFCKNDFLLRFYSNVKKYAAL